MNYNPATGETLTCPVCNKDFKVSEDTKYIAMGGFTCGWKCFMVSARSAASKRETEAKCKRFVNKSK